MKAKLTASLIRSLEPADKPYEVNDIALKGFLARVQPTGGITYYFAYRDKDRRKQRFRIGGHPTVTAPASRKKAEQLAAEVVQGGSPHAEKKVRRAAAAVKKLNTMNGFLENRYAPWVIAHTKRGEETLALLRYNFKALGERGLSDISLNDVELWRTEASKSGLAKPTINRRTGALKALINKAVDWEVIESNPIARLKALKVDKKSRVRYLSDSEEASLRTALVNREEHRRMKRESGTRWRGVRGYDPVEHVEDPEDYLKPIVLLALNTGMRRGELFSLRWVDVDLGRRQLTIVGADAKSEQTRYIDLNREAYTLLVEWQKRWGNYQLVFPNPRTGEQFDNIKSAWNGLREAAGLKNFRFHDLRHSFASKLVMKGVDLYVVKELLGHSSIEMTERYAHLAPSARKEAVARLDV